MRGWRVVVAMAGGVTLAVVCRTPAAAQQITTSSPMQQLGSGSFYQSGVQWGLRGPGFTFQFGGTPATPQFGNPNTGAGLQTGIGFGAGGWSGYFNPILAQGGSTTLSSVTPSVTSINGQGGAISDTSITPFVIGVVPVVAGIPSAAASGFGPAAIPGSPLAANNNAAIPGSNVQLPTFSYFGVATSVNVPDSGGALLGGVNRAGEGGKQFGPLGGQRSGGAQAQAGGVQVRAQIHDMAEMDAAVLSAAGQAAATASRPAVSPALVSAQQSSAGRSALSVAEAKQQHAAEVAAQQREVMAVVERARDAVQQGKPGVAKIHYQMALKRATGELRETIQAELQKLSPSGGSAASVALQGSR